MALPFYPLPEREEDGEYPSFAWPGGYPLYYLSADGSVYCPSCASQEAELAIVTFEINWEDDDLICEGCGERIESAYGEE